MNEQWANEFNEILPTLSVRTDLRDRMAGILPQDIWANATEGSGRAERLREILLELIVGRIGLEQSYGEVGHRLPRHQSLHANSNRVFAHAWQERLVRTQLSRFYNQTVLELLLENGIVRCFVPHSSQEDRGTRCSSFLAGKLHDTQSLLDMLLSNYRDGKWSKAPKIPDHPHCTHVVRPPVR